MKYSINTARKEMKNMINQYFRKDEKGNYIVDTCNMLPVFLIGPSGIGKTQIVGEIAKEMDLGFVSYSLVHHTRQTLMGLPVITSFSVGNNEVRDTEYTLSELLGAVYKEISNGKKEGILFLDEANCCPETIQPMLLSFLQSKVLGSNRLPEGWVIVLCGNPPRSIYNKNAREWDGALMDRLRVIDLKIDNEEYLNYIFEKEFHPIVRFYLTIHPENSYICERKEERMELVTYRSWENLSNALLDYEKLGFEITPVMVNEYIKTDRVVRDFYDLYASCLLDESDYSDVLAEIRNGSFNVRKIGTLKGKNTSILFGISRLYFEMLDKSADELWKKHEFLKKFREKVLLEEYDISDLVADSKAVSEIKEEAERIFKTLDNEKRHPKYVELHDQKIEQLKLDQEKLIQDITLLLQEFKKMENTVLLKYYSNTISRKKAWLYVLSGKDQNVVE